MDRHSKYALLEQVDRKTADSVAEVLTRRMMPFRDQVHTLTADNGKEFAGHQVVSKALAADFYFAAPYHSWERGLNEHTNGLVRQYCPKGTNFRKVTEEQVQAVEDGSTIDLARYWGIEPLQRSLLEAGRLPEVRPPPRRQ